jgi:hypothetical protein
VKVKIMFKTQKGVFPTLLKIIGLSAILFSMFITSRFILELFRQTERHSLIIPLFILSSITVPFFIFGFLFLSIFPDVRLSADGIRYRVWLSHNVVKWNEIENLIELNNGIIVVSIRRKGLAILRGLFFQRIIGYFIHHEYPVILLSRGLEHRKSIVIEIMNSCPGMKIRKLSDPYT